MSFYRSLWDRTDLWWSWPGAGGIRKVSLEISNHSIYAHNFYFMKRYIHGEMTMRNSILDLSCVFNIRLF